MEKVSHQVHLLFLHVHELLLMLLLVVVLLLLVVVYLFIHGLNEGVQADALLDRLFRWSCGWKRRAQWRRRSWW